MTGVDRLGGRVALVTGGSGAVGRATAVALAGAGADLCVVGRDEDRLAATVHAVRDTGAKAVPVVADLTSDEGIEAITEACRTFGGLDVLVHAAGTYGRGTLADASIEDLDAHYRCNVRAPYMLTKNLLGTMVERAGDIVFLNSTQGLSASGGIGQYAATQHGMRAVADSLRAEVNAKGVRVMVIHLGRTASELQRRVFEAEGRPYAPDPLIQPEDVADVIVSSVALPRRAQVTTLTIWPTART